MSKRIFCTYFDHRYLSRGLALIASLRAHGSQDEVWVLCMTEECHRVLSILKPAGVRLVRPADLEEAYDGLTAAKANRSTIEYYFTLTPSIVRYVFDQDAQAGIVAYLDADLFFFDAVDKAFAEVGDAPAAIIPHNFSKRMREQERFGTYNVGWVSFNRSEEGQRVLHWWQARCTEWCYDYVDDENDRFADQRYLQRFATIAPGTKVIRHPGMNTAPWNIENYRLEEKDGKVLVDGAPLIFFHFHGVKKRFGVFYFDQHRLFGAPHSALIRNAIYRPYIKVLDEASQTVDKLTVEPKPSRLPRSLQFNRIVKDISVTAMHTADLIQGRPIIVWGSKVI